MSGYNTPLFWERLWRTAGIQFAVLFIIAYAIYGYQPGVGAPAEALNAFYHGERTGILIAAIFSGLNLLNVYSRFIFPFIGLAWLLVVSRVLLTRSPAARAGW